MRVSLFLNGVKPLLYLRALEIYIVKRDHKTYLCKANTVLTFTKPAELEL